MSSPNTPSPAIYYRNGVLPIVSAATLWAFVYFFRKTALYGISPPLLVLLNSFIGAASLWIFYRFSLREIAATFWRAPIRFVGLGLTGVTLGTTFMICGLDHLDLGVTLVLEKLQPVFTCIFATIFLRETMRRAQFPWMVIAITASYFVSVKDPLALQISKSDAQGILATVGAALCWGISSVLGRSLVSLGAESRSVVFLRMLLGGTFLLPVVLVEPSFGLRAGLDVYVVTTVVLTAIFGSTLGYVLFYSGLRYVRASTSGFLELTTPLTGILLGALFLGEQPSWSQLVAIPAMLLSIAQLSQRPSSDAES